MKKLLALVLTIFLVSGKCLAADVGQLIIPAAPTHVISASYNNHTLDGATDQIEYMFQCEDACAIDALCIRQGTTTGTPPTYEARLEGVATTGRSDGTVKSSTNAKGDITLPGANAVACATLTSSYTCTKGEFLAGVVDYRTGTIDGSNNAGFTYSNANALSHRYPMSWTVDAGSATYRSGLPMFGYKCGSTYYGFLPETSGQHDFGSGSTGDERGNKFTIPASSCATFKIDAARFNGYVNSASNSLDIVIYENTTSRQDVTIDGDYDNSGGSAGIIQGRFEEGYTFNCGTEYVVAVKPNASGGTSAGLQYLIFDSANHQNSLPLGTTMFYTERTDAGSWSDNTSKRALIDLVLSDITEPSGGGITYSRGTGGNKQ